MSFLKRFVSPLLGAASIAAGLACGSAAAQDATATASKATQDAPQSSRDAASGLPTGKRQHKSMTMHKETGRQSSHHTMADMDTDKDGRMSRSEFAAAHGGRTDEFAGHDGNGDGFITQAEMNAQYAAMEAKHEAAQTMQQADGKSDH